ncbi:MAG TPA: serine/threonine-protein kinase [Candidatus Melainabacteria bacterium]|nr:serine/threonine-protein kinase [Candidatus Melainabacteria bacterium]
MSDTERKLTSICTECGFMSADGASFCPQDSTKLVSLSEDPLIGTIVADRYLILSALGRGGMSVVYKARHQYMHRNVALKMIRAELEEDSFLLKRLEVESKAISSLKHPNIVPVYDFGKLADGTPFLVMEYLTGCDLKEHIDGNAPLDYREVLPLFKDICDALAHAHRNGVIHRDIKPSNIIVTWSEDKGRMVPIVVDFGIARMVNLEGEDLHRLTATGQVFGSPFYMSPEQCRAAKPDARSDIYALGCVIYQALTGEMPVRGNTPFDTMVKHIQEKPRAFASIPDLPADAIPTRVEHCVFKALEKDPGNRFQSMEEFSRAIEGCLASSSKSLTRAAEFPPAGKVAALDSSGGKYGAYAILLLLISVLAIMGFQQFGSAPLSGSSSKSEPPQEPVQEPVKEPVSSALPVAAPFSLPDSTTTVEPPAEKEKASVSGEVGAVDRPLQAMPPPASAPAPVPVEVAFAIFDPGEFRRFPGWQYNASAYEHNQALVGLEVRRNNSGFAGISYTFNFSYDGNGLDGVSKSAFEALRRRSYASEHVDVGLVKSRKIQYGKDPGEVVKLDVLEFKRTAHGENPRTFVIYYRTQSGVVALQLIPISDSNNQAENLAIALAMRSFRAQP